MDHIQQPVSEHNRLLQTLEQLLSIEATDVSTALTKASDLVAEALDADKVDVFLYDPSVESLIADGTSNTPMGRLQKSLGLDFLPIANGGRTISVFLTGEGFITGRADEDPEVLPGIKGAMKVRSLLAVPLDVAGERRGVLEAVSEEPDKFDSDDFLFLQAVCRWVGMITHRTELVERLTRNAAEEARRVAGEELVTVLAHDLGNYITPLSGRIDLIRSRALREGDERYLRDAESAHMALQRLGGLIKDLLDVARLDQGMFALAPQPVDLVTLLKETADAMRTNDNKIDLVLPDELTAECDPARIRQAVENLLANAVKHSPRDMPVDLTLYDEKRLDGHWAIITVRDRGAGIPPELLPRLFTRFARGPSSGGLGLGLYLAHSIARSHGGDLEADTSVEQGAAFRLSIPVAQPLQ